MMRLLFLTLFMSLPVLAQNLMEERIWKVSPRKKSIFLDSGVFHHNSSLKGAGITSVRSSATPGQGYERVVVDFNTASVPKLYGHISPKDKKITMDFFEASIVTSQPQLKTSKNVKTIDFINVDGKSITMDLSMKGKSSFDIFYLENPGRLVIDIR
jgi:hypothetical protein